MREQYAKTLVSKKGDHQKTSLAEKSAYFLFAGAVSTLIAFISLLFIFILVSLLAGDPIPGVVIPEKIPTWGAAVILLAVYYALVFPLKALRFKFSLRRNRYALYRTQNAPEHGDATLWFALFILLFWYASEHKTELSAYLGNFPLWWRNFVDTVGPWFFQ